MQLLQVTSPRERSLVLRLGVLLVVFVPYFQQVMRLLQSDHPTARALCILFLVYAFAFGVVNAGVQAIHVLVFGRIAVDERDAAIDAVALRVAYFTLIGLLLAAFSTMAFLGMITAPSPTGTILRPTYSTTSQFVFFSIVVSEVARHVTQLYGYGRARLA